MLVRDVMSSPARVIAAGASVKDGMTMLDQHRVTSLPVTGQGGELVGIVSEADLLRGAVRHDPRAHLLPPKPDGDHPSCVADVMTTQVLTVDSDADLTDAVDVMLSTSVKSLPVLAGGRLVGMVSRSDVMHSLARSDDEIRVEIDDLLHSADLSCTVTVRDGVVTLGGFVDPATRPAAESVAGSVAGVISVLTTE